MYVCKTPLIFAGASIPQPGCRRNPLLQELPSPHLPEEAIRMLHSLENVLSLIFSDRGSPDPKRPRLSMPLPGPAPYSVPTVPTPSPSATSMGPPPIRVQTPIYPAQPSAVLQTIRPTISPAPSTMFPPAPMAPPPLPSSEERPQDAEQLQDALASAGVDLKAEEFNLSQIVTPSASIPPPNPFVFPQPIQPAHQIDDAKLIFNRLALSRVVDRIGKHCNYAVSRF